MKALNQFIKNLGNAAMRIFSPRQDNYPETGAQPYTGDPDRKNS